MGEISATASLSARVGVGHKKGWQSHDAISPHHSITFKRDVADDLTDAQLVEEAEKLHQLARKMVEKKTQEDIKELKKVD